MNASHDTAAVQRKYALVKVAAGDYILPSNDTLTFWRIAKYEDGPSHGIDPADIPRDKDFWGLWRWTGRREDLNPEWDDWVMEGSGFESRAEAVGEALRIG